MIMIVDIAFITLVFELSREGLFTRLYNLYEIKELSQYVSIDFFAVPCFPCLLL